MGPAGSGSQVTKLYCEMSIPSQGHCTHSRRYSPTLKQIRPPIGLVHRRGLELTTPVPETLATPLLCLVEKAGLNHVPADGKAPNLGKLCRRLRLATRAIELDADLPVSGCVCPYPLPYRRFSSTSRALHLFGSSERGPTESSWRSQHLGLTVETVCCVLAHLKREGTLGICVTKVERCCRHDLACEPRD
jgi:hypothetical protein